MSCTSTTVLRLTPIDVMNRLSHEPNIHTFPLNKHIHQRYLSLPEWNRVHSLQIDCDNEILLNVANKLYIFKLIKYWICKIHYVLF